MAKIKNILRRLSVPDKIRKAREILAAVAGNPLFPTPQPSLETVTGVTDDLDDAFHATQAHKLAGEVKTVNQNQKEDIFDRTFTQFIAYVESVAGDDELKLKSAGMDVKAPPVSSTAKPDVSSAVKLTTGDADGEIDMGWEPVDGAKSYLIETSPDPVTATSWSPAQATTKSKTTIGGLISGTRYWFRVAAVGVNGQGGWSNPVSKIAP
jgi:hypothetical protein